MIAGQTPLLYLMYVDAGRDVLGGPSSGTRFDMSGACRRCGTGARQIGSLLLEKFRPPSSGLFLTLDDELLSSESLTQLLVAAGFGFLGDVIDCDSNKPMRISQLVPQGTLPPFSENTSGYVCENSCTSCHRDGFFDTLNAPLVLKYRVLPRELLGMNLMATHERFGNSVLRDPLTNSHFAAPHYVVSARLKHFLEEKKVKKLEFLPVEISEVR